MAQERGLHRILPEYGENVQLSPCKLKNGLNASAFNPFFLEVRGKR